MSGDTKRTRELADKFGKSHAETIEFSELATQAADEVDRLRQSSRYAKHKTLLVAVMKYMAITDEDEQIDAFEEMREAAIAACKERE